MLLKKTYDFIYNKIVFMIIVLLFKFYKFFISPWLGNNCRFTPTCSEYVFESLQKFGLFKGFYVSLIRIAKCNPWGGCGYDPVDKK